MTNPELTLGEQLRQMREALEPLDAQPPQGFLWLPGTRWYAVSKNAEVIRFLNGKWKAVVSRLDRSGYVKFFVCESNSIRRMSLHSAVLLSHVGPKPSPSHQCRHLDGNRTNNHVSNLQWGTAKENAADRIRHGTQVLCTPKGRPGRVGSTNGNAKINDQAVRVMKLAYATGMDIEAIAQAFCLSPVNTREIISGRRWTHVKPSQAEATAAANAEKAALLEWLDKARPSLAFGAADNVHEFLDGAWGIYWTTNGKCESVEAKSLVDALRAAKEAL